MAYTKSYSKKLTAAFGKRFAMISKPMAHLMGVAFSVLANSGEERNYGKIIGILQCLNLEGQLSDNAFEELAALAERLLMARTSEQGHKEVESWIKSNE